jgi:proteasome accessory factor A
MKQRIYGLENEYGLIFSPNGRIYLPMEKVLGYIFEGLIPNSWPSNAFLVNGARFYQDTGCRRTAPRGRAVRGDLYFQE